MYFATVFIDGDNGRGTGTITAQKMFFRDKQKFHYLPIIMSDMRGKKNPESRTATNTMTIEIGDENNHPHGPGHKDIFVYKYDFKGKYMCVCCLRVCLLCRCYLYVN